MQATIRNVQYHPNQDSVAVLVENPLSQFYINLKQSDLAPEGENWGDAEILAATQAKLDADPQYAQFGFVAAYPPKPPVAQPQEVIEAQEELRRIEDQREAARRTLAEADAAEAAARRRLSPPEENLL
jgi:hypothetical protein